MKLIERYVFKRMLGAFLVAFPALSLTIWLTQALPHLRLVTESGQSVLTFARVTALLFPSLVMMIAPITVQIAVGYVLNALRNDAELVSINASGVSRLSLLKPVLALSALVAAMVAACTLYLTPMTVGEVRRLSIEAGVSVVGSLAREGKFRQLSRGVTVHFRSRDADGTIHGLFIYDPRDPEQVMTYIADRAALVENEAGQYLMLVQGVIQRQAPKTGTMTTIEFASYLLDLAAIASSDQAAPLPQERSLAYLLAPDSEDPYLRLKPNGFRAELHDRITAPLYTFCFGLIPLAFLGRVRSTRQPAGWSGIAAWVASISLRGAGLIVAGALASQPWLIPLAYALPLAGIGAALWFILADAPPFGRDRRAPSLPGPDPGTLPHKAGRRARPVPGE